MIPTPSFMFATSISESSGLCFNSAPYDHKRKDVSLREIQVCLSWKNKSFGLYSFHGSFEIPIVRILLGAVTCLPCVQHDEQVLGV